MGFWDVVVIALILAILGGAAWYTWRAKKRGQKCIGCPDGCACSSANCTGGCDKC